VVDSVGRAVGLNTHRVDDGFYLAQPVDDDFRTRLASLEAGTSPTRRTIGIAVVPPRVARRLRAAVGLPEHDGLLVRAVDPDGPAAAAGIREGDLVVQVGDRTITGVDDLHAVLDTWEGETCDLRVLRGSDELTITLSFS
jgi:serine protease Do